MEYFEVHTYAKHKSFEDILNSIDKLMFFVSPIVDREISQLKERNPNWVAGRIESEKFDNMIKWMTDRQLRSKDAMTEQKGGIMYEEDQFPKNNNHHPLNLILYGPPGTGKTYITKNLAVQIAENKSEKELNEIYPTRESLNEAFKKLQERGQIGFVTFHQSFGYEDFIEGIKPIMVDGKDGSPSSELGEQKVLNYEIKDGIFKMMSVRAESYQSFSSESKQMMFDKQIIDNLDKKQFFKMSLGNTANEDDQIIYEYCLENNCIALGWGQEIDYNRAKDEGEIGKLLEEHGGSQSSYEISAVKCFIFGMKVGDIVFISDGNLKARAIGMIEGNYFYDYHSTIYYKHFRRVGG
ncbi:MAG: AAA family ATPase [Saprospiraceae bacterium]|nr:AAA family ATPase [Saprospiraceae bacterium]